MKQEQAAAAAAPASKRKLEGMVIVFCGKLKGLRPMQAKKLAEELGARVSPFLSAQTTYIVVGERDQQIEAEAASLNIKSLNEDQWDILTGRAPAPTAKPARPKP